MRDSLLDSWGCSRKVSFVFEQSGAPFPPRRLIILVTKRPELSTILNCDTSDLTSRHSCRLTYKFCGASWLRVASWRCFSGFMAQRNSCSTSLACLFSDWIRFSRKKIVLFLGRSEPEFAVSLLPCHFTMKERWWRLLFPKNYVYVLRTTKTRHDFYFHFPANFQP